MSGWSSKGLETDANVVSSAQVRLFSDLLLEPFKEYYVKCELMSCLAEDIDYVFFSLQRQNC